MTELITQLLAAHPSLSVIITISTALRLILKPAMTAIEASVRGSGDQKSIDTLNSVEASRLYKILTFLVDLLTSFKLPVVQAAVTAGPDSTTPKSP